MWSSRWNENRQGKPKYSEKTCTSATLSTTNPTRSDLGSKPGRRRGKPATNRLSYGTAVSKELHIHGRRGKSNKEQALNIILDPEDGDAVKLYQTTWREIPEDSNVKCVYICIQNGSYVPKYLLTHGAEPYLRNANCAAPQELPSISWNPRVQYRVH
jgi:hypothetical protein